MFRQEIIDLQFFMQRMPTKGTFAPWDENLVKTLFLSYDKQFLVPLSNNALNMLHIRFSKSHQKFSFFLLLKEYLENPSQFPFPLLQGRTGLQGHVGRQGPVGRRVSHKAFL